MVFADPKWLALQPTDPLYKEMLNIIILLSKLKPFKNYVHIELPQSKLMPGID